MGGFGEQGQGRVDVEGMVNAHVNRFGGGRHAYLHDPVYHAQVHVFRSVLLLADRVMQDEGVPAHVRERVVRCVLYGCPDGVDASERLLAMKNVSDALGAVGLGFSGSGG